jgi:hypothetical protein
MRLHTRDPPVLAADASLMLPGLLVARRAASSIWKAIPTIHDVSIGQGKALPCS